ncbi:TPA: TldD/PmbA family protein [Candidatus Micrarchaeota archaeon]|nr:TldD/PmbA family protein [Candidatus Micrarchaeota archaeon]
MLGKILSYGADSAELFFQSDKGISIEIVNGSIKSAESNISSGYGLRVVKIKRIGFSSLEHEHGGNLKTATENAIKLSQLSKQSDFSFVSGSKFPRIRTVDKTLSGAGENDAKDWAYSVAAQIKKHTKTYRVIVSFSNSETGIENSEGFNSSYPSTNLSIYAEAMKGKSFGFSHFSSQFMQDSIEEIGAIASRMLKSMTNAKKPESGNYTVVFSQFAMKSVLGILLQSFSGDWKRKGIGILADKIQRKVFSDSFSLSDSPLSSGSASFPFDDEGTPARETKLIEKGVVLSFMYDRATAALDGASNTHACGSCSRSSYSSRPGIGYSNLIIGPGNYNDFEKELDNFILVESLHGAHTANALTGDFSLEVPVAFHFRKGKSSPVRGFMLSGNIFKLFNSILGIEKEFMTYDNLISPRIAFSEVNII